MHSSQEQNPVVLAPGDSPKLQAHATTQYELSGVSSICAEWLFIFNCTEILKEKSSLFFWLFSRVWVANSFLLTLLQKQSG
jgi:hypothetical protein